jgi:metal-responsive CopG/Arc/MetJ family transcriptional regulator
MARTTETIGFSVPPSVARQFEHLAKTEQRTKSELFREMVRVYERHREQREEFDEEWVMQIVREVEEEDRLHPMTQEELEREDNELLRYGAAQAKKLGIKDKDIDRLIHEHHKQRCNAGRI